MASAHSKGLLITVTGVVVLSPDALIIRSIDADQWTLLFWRGLLVGAVLSAVVLLRARRDEGARRTAIGMTSIAVSLSWGAAILFFIVSLAHTAAANTLVILSVGPLFTAMLSRPVLGEPVARRTWIAVLLVTAAVGLIFAGSLETGHLLGDLAALGGAVAMSICMVAIRHGRAVSMLPAIAAAHVVVALVALPLASPFSIGESDVWLLLLGGLIQLPLADLMIVAGPRYLPAPEVRLLALIETVLGPLWVWWGIGEAPSLRIALAAAVILPTLAAHAALGSQHPTSGAPERNGAP